VAAGLAKIFLDWHCYDADTRRALAGEMELVLARDARPDGKPCSAAVAEVVSSALQVRHFASTAASSTTQHQQQQQQ
jgi:hypothetical protein